MSKMIMKKALLVAGLSLMGTTTMAEPIPVELQKTDAGWQLLRGGEPYFIHGAGGDGPLDQLAAAGANSVRTWGGDGRDYAEKIALGVDGSIYFIGSFQEAVDFAPCATTTDIHSARGESDAFVTRLLPNGCYQ